MLWTALRDPDPVLIFEHGSLYNVRASWTTTPARSTSTRAAVRRPGADVTLITYGGTLPTRRSTPPSGSRPPASTPR